jgi:hypothetical protein
MKTLADSTVRASLIARLDLLQPDAPRRWGTLEPHEMLCHLGDALEMVLRTRPRKVPVRVRHRPLIKFAALRGPLRWWRGIRTNPEHNPRDKGTRPSSFEADKARLVRALHALAVADPSSLEIGHGLLGAMSVTDWQRWAYRHADHHLRQFGV